MPVEAFIASPLEAELVERIRAAEPRAHVDYAPELLPPPRYPSDHTGDPDFRRGGVGERRFADFVRAAEVLFGIPLLSGIPGAAPASLAAAVRAAPSLRWVQGTAAGAGEQLRAAGLTAAELDRVTLTSARGVHARQLAEWAMFGLLAFTKGLPRLLADQAERRWGHYPLRELAGQTVLIIGLGEIGGEVARAARALRMHTIGVRRTVPESGADESPAEWAGDRAGERVGDETVDELDATADLPALVGRADAVVLALPATPATAGLFDRALIDALPAHAIVVNVGRGGTLDQAALTDALVAGRIGGAALEVFATEPLPEDDPLWTLPNVLISPHTAALSTRENERIVDLFCDNLRRYCDGRPLRNVIDAAQFY